MDPREGAALVNHAMPSPPRVADSGRSPGPTWAVGVMTRTHRPPVFRWLGRHSVEFFAVRIPGLASGHWHGR